MKNVSTRSVLRIAALVLSVGLAAGYVGWQARSASQPEAPEPSAPHLFSGSKSKVITLPEGGADAPPQRLLPGSKSIIFTPSSEVTPEVDPAGWAEPEPPMLFPGSKSSMVDFSPSIFGSDDPATDADEAERPAGTTDAVDADAPPTEPRP